MRHVLPFYLHINSSIDHVLLNVRKKRAGSKKNTKQNSSQITTAIQETKTLLTHGHIPHSSQGWTHHTYTLTVHSWRQTYTNKHTLLHTHTHNHHCFHLSSAAQHVFGCQSINIDSHVDSTYSFIRLLIHLLILYISCQGSASCWSAFVAELLQSRGSVLHVTPPSEQNRNSTTENSCTCALWCSCHCAAQQQSFLHIHTQHTAVKAQQKHSMMSGW